MKYSIIMLLSSFFVTSCGLNTEVSELGSSVGKHKLESENPSELLMKVSDKLPNFYEAAKEKEKKKERTIEFTVDVDTSVEREVYFKITEYSNYKFPSSGLLKYNKIIRNNQIIFNEQIYLHSTGDAGASNGSSSGDKEYIIYPCQKYHTAAIMKYVITTISIKDIEPNKTEFNHSFKIKVYSRECKTKNR